MKFTLIELIIVIALGCIWLVLVGAIIRGAVSYLFTGHL